MNNTVKVEIHWAEWKVPRIEAPGRYVAPAKFEQDAATWPNDVWSIVLEFEEIGNGTARFLAEEAPHQRLKRGIMFEMYEGPKMSAKINIL